MAITNLLGSITVNHYTRMQKAFIEHDLKRYRYDEGQIDHSAVKTNN